MHGYLEEHDVILSPVNAKPAIFHGTTDFPDYSYTVTYTRRAGRAWWCVAGPRPRGCRVGVQVVSAPAREDIALAVAVHLEEALGGFQPPPI